MSETSLLARVRYTGEDDGDDDEFIFTDEPTRLARDRIFLGPGVGLTTGSLTTRIPAPGLAEDELEEAFRAQLMYPPWAQVLSFYDDLGTLVEIPGGEAEDEDRPVHRWAVRDGYIGRHDERRLYVRSVLARAQAVHDADRPADATPITAMLDAEFPHLPEDRRALVLRMFTGGRDGLDTVVAMLRAEFRAAYRRLTTQAPWPAALHDRPLPPATRFIVTSVGVAFPAPDLHAPIDAAAVFDSVAVTPDVPFVAAQVSGSRARDLARDVIEGGDTSQMLHEAMRRSSRPVFKVHESMRSDQHARDLARVWMLGGPGRMRGVRRGLILRVRTSRPAAYATALVSMHNVHDLRLRYTEDDPVTIDDVWRDVTVVIGHLVQALSPGIPSAADILTMARARIVDVYGLVRLPLPFDQDRMTQALANVPTRFRPLLGARVRRPGSPDTSSSSSSSSGNEAGGGGGTGTGGHGLALTLAGHRLALRGSALYEATSTLSIAKASSIPDMEASLAAATAILMVVLGRGGTTTPAPAPSTAGMSKIDRLVAAGIYDRRADSSHSVACQRQYQPLVDDAREHEPPAGSYDLMVNGHRLVCIESPQIYPGFKAIGIPCCYKTDQRHRPEFLKFNTDPRYMPTGRPVQTKSPTSDFIVERNLNFDARITKLKILTPGRVGTLPWTLEMVLFGMSRFLFVNLHPADQAHEDRVREHLRRAYDEFRVRYEFHRIGTVGGRDSLLHALLTILYNDRTRPTGQDLQAPTAAAGVARLRSAMAACVRRNSTLFLILEGGATSARFGHDPDAFLAALEDPAVELPDTLVLDLALLCFDLFLVIMKIPPGVGLERADIDADFLGVAQFAQIACFARASSLFEDIVEKVADVRLALVFDHEVREYRGEHKNFYEPVVVTPTRVTPRQVHWTLPNADPTVPQPLQDLRRNVIAEYNLCCGRRRNVVPVSELVAGALTDPVHTETLMPAALALLRSRGIDDAAVEQVFNELGRVVGVLVPSNRTAGLAVFVPVASSELLVDRPATALDVVIKDPEGRFGLALDDAAVVAEYAALYARLGGLLPVRVAAVAVVPGTGDQTHAALLESGHMTPMGMAGALTGAVQKTYIPSAMYVQHLAHENDLVTGEHMVATPVVALYRAAEDRLRKFHDLRKMLARRIQGSRRREALVRTIQALIDDPTQPTRFIAERIAEVVRRMLSPVAGDIDQGSALALAHEIIRDRQASRILSGRVEDTTDKVMVQGVGEFIARPHEFILAALPDIRDFVGGTTRT